MIDCSKRPVVLVVLRWYNPLPSSTIRVPRLAKATIKLRRHFLNDKIQGTGINDVRGENNGTERDLGRSEKQFSPLLLLSKRLSQFRSRRFFAH